MFESEHYTSISALAIIGKVVAMAGNAWGYCTQGLGMKP